MSVQKWSLTGMRALTRKFRWTGQINFRVQMWELFYQGQPAYMNVLMYVDTLNIVNVYTFFGFLQT